jgi:hypothetical protein
MNSTEIEVPKELREFMISGAEETFLGQKNGAKRQFRYGNLHIREYDDKFLVHVDKIDPRKDPMGHLIHDAPEVLIGVACSIFSGIMTKKFTGKTFSEKQTISSVLLSSIISGYLGYELSKKIKSYLERR